jgi:hypothetical protein
MHHQQQSFPFGTLPRVFDKGPTVDIANVAHHVGTAFLYSQNIESTNNCLSSSSSVRVVDVITNGENRKKIAATKKNQTKK